MSWLLNLYPGDGAMLLLGNALAQSALAIALAWIVGATLARRNAALRYAVYLAALAVVLASPMTAFAADRLGLSVLSIPVHREVPAELPSLGVRPEPGSAMTFPSPPEPSSATPVTIGDQPKATSPVTPPSASAVPAAPVDPVMTPVEMLRAGLAVLLIVWGAGTLFLLARMLHGWGVLTSLRHELKPLEEQGLEDVLAQVRVALDVKKLPAIATSGLVGNPITVGLFKPTVVLPRHLQRVLSPRELADVLTHECAHVVQRDHLTGFAQRLVEMFYWLLPLVHVLNKRLSAAREEVCDNYVLRQSDPRRYAECLVNLAGETTVFLRMPTTVGLVHPRWRMEDRIKGIVDKRRKLMTRMNTWTLVAVATSFLATGVVIAGCKVRGKTDNISWGKAVGDLRVGVSPAAVVLGEKTRNLSLRIWCENVGRKPVTLPAGGNVLLSDGGESFHPQGRFVAGRSGALKAMAGKTLSPGKRLGADVTIALKEIDSRLTHLAPGQSIVVRVGVPTVPYNAPRGKFFLAWDNKSVAKSGPVTVSRAAGASSNVPALDGTGWSEPYPRGMRGEWPEPGEAKGGVAEVTEHGLKTRVVWLRGGNIFLAAGTEQGVALNVEFALTRGERKVGTAKVHKLSEKMALCRAVSLVEAPHVGDTAMAARQVSWGKNVNGLRAGLSTKTTKFEADKPMPLERLLAKVRKDLAESKARLEKGGFTGKHARGEIEKCEAHLMLISEQIKSRDPEKKREVRKLLEHYSKTLSELE